MAIRGIHGMTVAEMRQAVRDERAANPGLVGQTRGFSRMRRAELINLLGSLPSQQQGPTPGSHVVWDVETTGLHPEAGDVAVQLAAQIHVPGRDPVSYETLINPGERAISPGAQEVHGISQEQVAGAPSQEEAWGELDRLISSVGGVEYSVGHNVEDFDIRFAPPASSLRQAQQIDTLKMARQIITKQEAGGSHALGALAETLGLSEFQAHDAAGDVQATKQLLDTLVQMAQAGGVQAPGITPQADLPPGAQKILGARQPRSVQQQEPQTFDVVDPTTGAVRSVPATEYQEMQAAKERQQRAVSDYDQVLTDFMEYGYGRGELRDMLRRGLGESGTPKQAREFLTQEMGRLYGPKMERSRYSAIQQRYMEEPRRARGREEYPWDTERLGAMPSAKGEGWQRAQEALGAQEPIFTRQGAASFYPVRTLTQSGYWIPTEAGGVTMPVKQSKAQKRGQGLGAHDVYDIYQYESGLGRKVASRPTGAGKLLGRGYPAPAAPSPAARETSQYAPLRGGPLSAVPQRGTVMRTAMPLATVTESGMGALGEGVIESVRSRVPKDIKFPRGFKPESLAEPGATWELGQDIKLFEGAAPLDIGMRRGAWEQARLVDIAETEEGVRAVLERSIAPERAGLYAKTGIGKMTMPVTDIQAMTGRSDIEAIAEYKEPLGAAWSFLMGKDPEQLKAMLEEQGYEGKLPETWQEGSRALVGAFQAALPQMTEDVTYRKTVHETAREGYRELAEKYGGTLDPIKGREGYYQF